MSRRATLLLLLTAALLVAPAAAQVVGRGSYSGPGLLPVVHATFTFRVSAGNASVVLTSCSGGNCSAAAHVLKELLSRAASTGKPILEALALELAAYAESRIPVGCSPSLVVVNSTGGLLVLVTANPRPMSCAVYSARVEVVGGYLGYSASWPTGWEEMSVELANTTTTATSSSAGLTVNPHSAAALIPLVALAIAAREVARAYGGRAEALLTLMAAAATLVLLRALLP